MGTCKQKWPDVLMDNTNNMSVGGHGYLGWVVCNEVGVVKEVVCVMFVNVILVEILVTVSCRNNPSYV